MSSDVFPAKVAHVLDVYTLVVNRGSEQGIQKGQRLYIWADGPSINDPDTGEHLGSVKLVRGTGRVQSVQDKLCTVVADMQKVVIKNKGRSILSPRIDFGTLVNPEYEDLPFDNPAVGDWVVPV